MYEFAVTPAITQLRRPGVTITEVTPDSLGEELELSANDRIVKDFWTSAYQAIDD